MGQNIAHVLGRITQWRYSHLGKPLNTKWDVNYEVTKAITLGFLETLFKLKLYE